jgi:hypothetical protein
LLGFAAVAVMAAVLFYLGGLSGWRPPGHEVHGTSPPEPDSPELQLCRQFMGLKNAGDPRAAEFLEPAPNVPASPVTQAEAGLLDAQFMLHTDYEIRGIRAVPTRDAPPRFVLALHGGGACQELLVRSGSQVDRIQRVVRDPDLVVEVRDGKLHGLELRLHED